MKHWFNQQAQAFSLVAKRMMRNKLSTLMMFSVIGVALCLPGVFYVIIGNLTQLTNQVQSEPQISLFLKLDVTPQQVKELEAKIKNHTSVKNYRFVSKESAWEQLQQNESTNSVGLSLNKNPLPDAFFIQPNELTPETIKKLQTEMKAWDGVEIAQADANWVKRLFSILALGQKAALGLILLFGSALLIIIGNATRLQILTQQHEIEISRLIGATDGFIRRPFLYAGVFYGLGGGLTACLMLEGVVASFNRSIAEISALYQSDFTLSAPDIHLCLALTLVAILLGWLGSYVAVSNSLAKFKASA